MLTKIGGKEISFNIFSISSIKFSYSYSPSNFISFMAYNDSKLCNILTAQYLHRRLCKHNVTVVSCHPGNLVYTNLQRYWWLLRVLYFLFSPFTKSAVRYKIRLNSFELKIDFLKFKEPRSFNSNILCCYR